MINLSLFENKAVGKKIASIFVTLLLATFVLLSFPYVQKISVQSAYPYEIDGPNSLDIDAVPPPVVPCLETIPGQKHPDPEFHSLRPYQASPCGDSPKAYFCSNDYTIIEDVSMTWSYGDCADPGQPYICYPPPNAWIGREPVFIIGGEDGRDYYITLSKVEYPILGNTQDVINSQSSLDTFGAIQKMNEYVNWYLQGVIDKAEYGDTAAPADFPTYAGPTKKLLPQDFLNFRRLQVLHDAGTHPHPPLQLDPTEFQGVPLGIDPTTGMAIVDETTNHNQIAVCTSFGVPIPCWPGNNNKARSPSYRLVTWWEGKGSTPKQTFYNWGPFDTWGGATPPFPWQFTNSLYYMKSYMEWKGASCFILNGGLYCLNLNSTATTFCNLFSSGYCAVVNAGAGLTPSNSPCNTQTVNFACQASLSILTTNPTQTAAEFCTRLIDLSGLSSISSFLTGIAFSSCVSVVTPLLPNVPPSISTSTARNLLADLYRFVPLGNSADKNAKHVATGLHADGPGQTIVDVLSYSYEKEPVLHYPHTESTVQVSNLLNQINTPLDCEPNTDEDSFLTGEGFNCCSTGYYHFSGICLNNNVRSSCEDFATGLCGVINPLYPGSCNAYQVSNACQSAVARGSFVSQNSETICSSILSSAGLGFLGYNAIRPCQSVIGTFFDIFSSPNISQEIQCGSGLVCSQQGICEANSEAKLKCNKIGGFGTRFEPTTCEFVEVRTNEGDNLTFKKPPSYLFADNVMIRVEQIECQNTGELNRFFSPPPDGCGGQVTHYDRCLSPGCDPNSCGASCTPGEENNPFPQFCSSWPPCKAEVRVILPTVPKIPYADAIWKNTVVDKNTSFRRIFPKLEPGAPVDCIKEIPGVSNVSYVSGLETNLTQISTAGPNVYPGNGPSSVSEGQLFFPHLGTIYEYFLKGIQSALRPREYSGLLLPNGDAEICDAMDDLGDCKQWLFETDKKGQYYYDKIIEYSNSVSCSRGHLNPFWAITIALNETGGLYTNDPDGDAYAHFGCDRCTLGTIEDKMACMGNTLRTDCAQGKTDEEALAEYGYPAGYAFGPMQALTGSTELPPLFGSNFDVGQLKANLLGVDWKAYYPNAAQIFCTTPLYKPPDCN